MRFLLCLAFFAVAAAHASEPVTAITSANFNEVVGTDWQLSKMLREGKEIPLEKDAVVTLAFEKTGGISGNGSVNRYFGSVKVAEDGSLKWSEIGMTQMAGPEPLMRQEADYTSLLQRMTVMRLREGKLFLESSDGQTRLVFTAPQ